MNESSKLGSYWISSTGSVYQLLTICRDSKGGLVFVAERCTETGESFYEGSTETVIGLWQGQVRDMKPFTPKPKLKPGLVLADNAGHTQAFLLENKWHGNMFWRLVDNPTWHSQEGWEAKGYTNFRQATRVGGGGFDVTVD